MDINKNSKDNLLIIFAIILNFCALTKYFRRSIKIIQMWK